MSDAGKLVLERLREILGEQAAERERDLEILSRLDSITGGVAQVVRYESLTRDEFAEGCCSMDRLRERVERIEHYLGLS